MKITVQFMGPLQRDDVVLDIQDNGQFIDEIQKYIPQEFIDSVSIAINNQLVSKVELQDGDVVTILPPVCGG
ncbi:MAG: hypothetical protein GXO40_04320 [Epsilonproteobacteria bacterium]|nr:hypothetical protein [Campylobacterota bacterium]